MTDQPWTPPDEEQQAGNLAHWTARADVPEKFQKKQTHGAKLTAWDANWAKRECTRLWGPYGTCWGLRNIKLTPIAGEKGYTDGIMMEAEFFCPVSEPFTIVNDMSYNPNRETLKCLQTNTLKKALSYLGWATNLALGKFEDDELDAVSTDPRRRKPSQYSKDAVRACYEANDEKTIDHIVNKAKGAGLDALYMGQIYTAAKARKTQIQQEAMNDEASDVFDGKDDSDMPKSGLSPRTDP